jgi:CRISPR-associated Csx11 family protein
MVIAADYLNRDRRRLILFVELAALLHDIGKLSSHFISYRQRWQQMEDGWNNDPHEKWFSDSIENLSNVPDGFGITLAKLGISVSFSAKDARLDDSADFSVKKAVRYHGDPKDGDILIQLIKAADCNDSAVDRNNPLFSAEQLQGESVYKSNVFGFESSVIEPEALDVIRGELYDALSPLLKIYFDGNGSGAFMHETRGKIMDQIKKAFSCGLSDTTRPQNDTSLWEHVYAVASIAKVLTVHNLICESKIATPFSKEFQYGIWGVGWDGLNFLSYGQKIGDITARKRIIEDIKTEIRNLVEYEYPIGNCIYHDDDGIYFIVPSQFGPNQNNMFKEIHSALEKQIINAVSEKSENEIQPFFQIESGCAQLTRLVHVIEQLRSKRAFRFDNGQANFIHKLGFEDNREVCPICRMRPAEAAVYDEKICRPCADRRKESSRLNSSAGNTQTIFIDEIVDENQRAALLVARFDLLRWLSGTMVRTLFVSEARGIEKEIRNLGEIRSFTNNGEEERVRRILAGKDYDYTSICRDIDGLIDDDITQEDRNIAFIYSHGRKGNVPLPPGNDCKVIGGLKGYLDKCKSELSQYAPDIWRYNVINAKSPTPSTLLDVWQTTERFFAEAAVAVIQKICPSVDRICIELGKPVQPVPSGTCEADLDGKKVELLFTSDRRAELILNRSDTAIIKEKFNRSKKLSLTISDKGYTGAERKFEVEQQGIRTMEAFRIITASPHVFMAIVPADKAVDISSTLYDRYQIQFGKVTGRLPFSVGTVFFKRRMPMFIVLDTARRMLDRFKELSAEGNDRAFTIKGKHSSKDHPTNGPVYHLTVSASDESAIKWRLPAGLGSGGEDFHHSYAFVEGNRYAGRKGYFKTIAGDVLPFKDLQIGDKVKAHPNYFDFIFLDSNQKRLDMHCGIEGTNPFMMEEIKDKFCHIWGELIRGQGLRGMTQAKLKNIQALWVSKYIQWGGAHREFERLVEATLKKEFPPIGQEETALLLETTKSGLFFRMLELQLGILKGKVQPGGPMT